MNDQILIKKKIKENLPYGALTEIARIVNKKRNKKISVSHVSNVINPLMKSWDAEIITVAQSIILKRNREIISAKEAII